MIIVIIVTLPPWERYLNWVPDHGPPPTRYHGDLTSPAPSEDQENTPPQDASRKLPRRLRPRRRKEKQPGSSTNGNPASRVAGSVTQLGSPVNRNSALSGSSTATRPRSVANENSPLPGNRPGASRSSRSTPVEHPWTFLHPQYPQHPRLSTNHNSERRFDPNHPEFRGVYKPAQPSIQQDGKQKGNHCNCSSRADQTSLIELLIFNVALLTVNGWPLKPLRATWNCC